MKKAFYASFLFIAIFLSAALIKAQNKADMQNPESMVPNDPNVIVGKLDNGLKYYIKENKKPEKRLELRLAVHTGAVDEDKDQYGLAHLTEHMAFNGTKNFPKDALVKYLESIGMRFGADLNAYTDFQETVYMLEIPTDNPEILEKGFQVLEDWSHNLSFDDVEIDKERGVVMEEWRLGRGAEDRIWRKQYPILFYNSQFATHDVIGDTSVILKASHETLKRYYKDWYRPDLMAVAVAGDYDPKKLEQLVKKHFGNIETAKNERKKINYPIPYHKETFASIETDKELAFPDISIYFKHPAGKKGSFGDFRQDIISNLFTEMLTKRLEELRRSPMPPFIFANASEGLFMGDCATFTVSASAKGDGILDGYKSLLAETFRIYQHGFTQTELDRQKEEMMKYIEKTYNEREKTESRSYVGEYIRNFLNGEAIPGIVFENDYYQKALPGITLEEVNTLAKKMIHKDNTVILLSAPEKVANKMPSKQDILTLFDEYWTKQLDPYVDEVLTQPIFNKNVTPGKVVSENKVPDVDLTEWKLSNGVKVILKKTDYKNDEVLFKAFKYGGLSLSSDPDYMSAASSPSIFNASGLGDFDENQLQKMLSGKIVRVSAGIGELTEGMQGTSSLNDLETMFQLINLRFTSPRKDLKSFQSFMERTRSQVENSENSPEKAYYDTLQSVMTQYHFRARPRTLKTLEEVNFDKAYKFYQERYADANDFCFIFVGNFEYDSIKPLVEKYIGSLPGTNKKETFRDINMNPPKGKLEKTVYAGMDPKATVTMMFTGDIEWNRQNIFDVRAMLDLLDIRLREVIREDSSGTYGIYSYPNIDRYPKPKYNIYVGFGCAPDRVEDLTKGALAVIDEVKTKLEDSSYIEKVAEIHKRELEKNMKENRWWISQLNDVYMYGLEPKSILDMQKMIDNISAEKIRKTAQKYFDMKNFARFILLPEKKN